MWRWTWQYWCHLPFIQALMGASASVAVISASCVPLLADFCSPTCTSSSLSSNFLSLLFPLYFIPCPLFRSTYQDKRSMTTSEQQIIKSQQNLQNKTFQHKVPLIVLVLSSVLWERLYLHLCFFSYSFSCLWRAACSSHHSSIACFSPCFSIHCTAFSECCDISSL